MAEAWEAAVEVTAAAYRVDPAILRAASRGRGPKPPLHARLAKKIAVYITVVVSECNYADLARALGFHRDTITSHCADIRCASDADGFEERLLDLERSARDRLAARGAAIPFLPLPDVSTRALLISLHAKVDLVLAALAVGQFPVHPTNPPDHENVIDLSQKRVSA